MKESTINKVKKSPVIAAVQTEKDLDAALRSNAGSIILLCADIFNAKVLVEKIKAVGKNAIIHMDFLEGIGRDSKALDYIIKVIDPDGVISTKSSHIKAASSKGIFTIQRFFLIDNKSYEMTLKSIKTMRPDMIEVMPGVMPNVIRRITGQMNIPVIAGGLIDNEQDIKDALQAGAVGVSTSKKNLWNL
ncbi:MAG: glycerol-3-phosphate responsive antiterminator [Clostridiales bacterium]|nr:glycerol-3-phosphate responsive antiterminator [Clostridiales bacterium]